MLGATSKRWLADPLLHFFLLAALLFVVHRLLVGDARTIALNSGTKADVARHFRDQSGRAPTASELDAALREWRRDEALYREALREGLDRDDLAVRTVLIDKMRARAMLQAPQRQPTAAELEQWLTAHRELYEAPRRYAIEWLNWRRAESNASAVRERLESKLQHGADPRFLGQPLYGATLTSDELRQKLGREFVARIDAVPLRTWQRAETENEFFVLRVVGVEGGLPPADELRPRLLVDWSHARQRAAAQRLLDQLAARYRFEEGP